MVWDILGYSSWLVHFIEEEVIALFLVAMMDPARKSGDASWFIGAHGAQSCKWEADIYMLPVSMCKRSSADIKDRWRRV